MSYWVSFLLALETSQLVPVHSVYQQGFPEQQPCTEHLWVPGHGTNNETPSPDVRALWCQPLCYSEVHPGLYLALMCLLWPDPSRHLETTLQVVVGIADDVGGWVQAHPRAASAREERRGQGSGAEQALATGTGFPRASICKDFGATSRG